MTTRTFWTAFFAASMLFVAKDVQYKNRSDAQIIEDHMVAKAKNTPYFELKTLEDKTACEFGYSPELGTIQMTVMPVLITKHGETTGLTKQVYQIQTGFKGMNGLEIHSSYNDLTKQDVERATKCFTEFANGLRPKVQTTSIDPYSTPNKK